MKKISKLNQFILPARLMCGIPAMKLHKYFIQMDDVPFRGDPLTVRNWVVSNTVYAPDRETYGVDEHWPRSYSDLQDIITARRDDCDGLSVLVASILHTLGNKDVRLAIGYQGIGDHAYGNHTWAMVHTDELYIIDCADKRVLSELPRLKMSPLYKPHIMCDAKGNYWEF